MSGTKSYNTKKVFVKYAFIFNFVYLLFSLKDIFSEINKPLFSIALGILFSIAITYLFNWLYSKFHFLLILSVNIILIVLITMFSTGFISVFCSQNSEISQHLTEKKWFVEEDDLSLTVTFLENDSVLFQYSRENLNFQYRYEIKGKSIIYFYDDEDDPDSFFVWEIIKLEKDLLVIIEDNEINLTLRSIK